jgi:hypothetical protein
MAERSSAAPQRSLQTRAAASLLILGMIAGSLAMWIGAPVFWLWLGSHLQKSSQPSMGPYLLIFFGIIVSMVVLGKFLGRLNRTYGRVTGTAATVRVRLPWHRSMRGERDSGRPSTVLDVVMVATVAGALAVLGIWFLFFARLTFPG